MNSIHTGALTIVSIALSGLLGSHNALAQTAPSSWSDKITLGADFRLRTQQTAQDGSATDWVNRIQARANLTGKVNEAVTVRFRLTSDGDNPITSSNQTLDGAGGKKPISLDLAYFDWTATEGMNISGGKIPNPYWTAGKQQLIWDSDVTFEGAAIRYANNMDALKLTATAGGFWIDDRDGDSEGPDILLSGAQIGTGYKTDAFNTTLGVAYYTYGGLKESPALGPGTSLRGNSTGTAVFPIAGSASTQPSYRFDYNLLDIGFEVGTDTLGLPLLAYVDYVQNGDPSDNNTGILYGLRVGKLKDVGSWALDYNYRDLKADAVVAAFADGDFADGRTDSRGHRVSGQNKAGEGFVAILTYIGSERNISTIAQNFERWQLDLSFTY